MTNHTPQQQAATIIAAISHLLMDCTGRLPDLDSSLAVMTGGPVDTLTLLNWTDWIRRTGRNIVHVSFPKEHFPIPVVSMVVVDETGHGIVFESCWLWLPQSGGRCWIIPEGHGWGAYRLDGNLALKNYARAPVRRGTAATAGYLRAYERLMQIANDQRANGIALPLPTILTAQAA